MVIDIHQPGMTMTKATAKTVAIYTRVSTDAQTTENQERDLRAIASHMG
jgi:hypothetical protein